MKYEGSPSPPRPENGQEVPPLGELIPLTDLPRNIPVGPGGRRLHAHVPYRWATKGLAGVMLRTITLPGTGKATTINWYRTFVAEVAAARSGERTPPTRPRRRPAASPNRIERTQEVLARHDLGDRGTR